MPISGIRKLLGQAFPDPSLGSGISWAELYLCVDDAAAYHKPALAHGAIELSRLVKRDWGQVVAYSLDPDGHVLAVAEKIVSWIKWAFVEAVLARLGLFTADSTFAIGTNWAWKNLKVFGS